MAQMMAKLTDDEIMKRAEEIQASGKPSKDGDAWGDIEWVSAEDPTPRPDHYDGRKDVFGFTYENYRDALKQLEQENRHGVKYKWPADHDFGKLERAIDDLMFELEQLPPLTWMHKLADWISRKP
jgi:hypothetical protein